MTQPARILVLACGITTAAVATTATTACSWQSAVIKGTTVAVTTLTQEAPQTIKAICDSMLKSCIAEKKLKGIVGPYQCDRLNKCQAAERVIVQRIAPVAAATGKAAVLAVRLAQKSKAQSLLASILEIADSVKTLMDQLLPLLQKDVRNISPAVTPPNPTPTPHTSDSPRRANLHRANPHPSSPHRHNLRARPTLPAFPNQ